MTKFGEAYVQVAGSSIGKLVEEQDSKERAIMAQSSKNNSKARRFATKGEKDDEILALKRENSSLKNQNAQLKQDIVKLHTKLNSAKPDGSTGPTKQDKVKGKKRKSCKESQGREVTSGSTFS